MKVFVDADGCPVTDIVIRVCQKYQIPCILLCDTAHEFHRDGAQTVIVDKGADSVDFALIQRAHAGDWVVTQDYGLASMCLAKNVRVLHQDGWEYSSENIDELLFQRHTARKIRAAGGRTKGPRKRTEQQNHAFEAALNNILQRVFQG